MGGKSDKESRVGVGGPSGKVPKRNQIDESLKRVYKEMLEEDVPDRFEELLKQLREQDKS
ncbi:NepR family anti-sigma factor [Roseovarius nanhaiticus]|uniref:NepR family anti-sigma factor n=1 Tax=Roseovarius nanhaiticus TaxID=573024 RepID=UPI0024907834|nr:NepR family anti-sigma factor [Roseovarius nanhaiticus]